jgi:hypothetical protein
VALDDLASPHFDAGTEAILAAMAEMAPSCPLEPEALCQAASEQTGLDDFGDPSALERLAVLCTALRDEAGLSGPGVVSLHSQLLQLLKNRLLVTDLLARHPEIHDQTIERPIIICGLPRTGTTHLHNLISSDRTLRSLPYWESIEPVPDPREQHAAGELDPRRARCEMAVDVMNAALPYFKRMHEMTVDHVHEEIQLLAVDVSTMLFETLAPVPSWRDYYRAHDQTPSYEYLRTLLKVLQWQDAQSDGAPSGAAAAQGRPRWVLKSPQHLEQFRPLLSVFPDATFIVTHRDPVPVTVSMATMVAYTARLSLAEVDPVALGRYWAAQTEQLFRACTDDRDLLPADRTVDVRFDELTTDDVGTVACIYEVAGQPFTADTRAAMEAFMATHPRGRHGTVVQDPAAVGIDPAERRRALAFYSERFGVGGEAG